MVKMVGTRNQELLQLAKKLWNYMLANWIAVTVEHLPGSLNIQADWQSRTHKDSSDLKLNPKILSHIVKIRGIPQIDLLASLLNHQLPKCMSWHLDPGSCAVDFLHYSWRNLYGYAFLPFCLIVSKLAATLITNSRKSASIFNYQSAWQMWASWCYEWEVNPFTRNIIETLNFLAFLYEGYEYSSMNSHMSTISAYHVHTDNNPIG